MNYSKEKYISANGITETSWPFRYVTAKNEDGENVIHQVDVRYYDEKLLPGGKRPKEPEIEEATPVATMIADAAKAKKPRKAANKTKKATKKRK